MFQQAVERNECRGSFTLHTTHCGSMRGSRNFHEKISNFWSQTRGGGRTLKKLRNYLFLGKIFKFQGGGPDPRSPLWIRAWVHSSMNTRKMKFISYIYCRKFLTLSNQTSRYILKCIKIAGYITLRKLYCLGISNLKFPCF